MTNVANLTGGFGDWKGAGHPVERGVPAGGLVSTT
jgi:rhodanese-related sulfurtransferase